MKTTRTVVLIALVAAASLSLAGCITVAAPASHSAKVSDPAPDPAPAADTPDGVYAGMSDEDFTAYELSDSSLPANSLTSEQVAGLAHKGCRVLELGGTWLQIEATIERSASEYYDIEISWVKDGVTAFCPEYEGEVGND